MSNQIIAKLGVLSTAILAIPAISFAGTASAGKDYKDHKMIEKCKESCITGDLGVNAVSQYVSRGVVLENQELILQPYADLYFRLYQGEGFLNKVSLNLGVWSSFHSEHTDAVAGSTTRGWYEFDFTAGVSFTFAKNFTFTPSYYSFLSPNDGFNTFQGLNLALSYDDTDLLGKFALHPHVTVLFELENKAGTGSDEGVYYEVGIAPSLPLGPVTLTFPITAGFGSDDFYGSVDSKGNPQDEGFGYVSAGVTVGYAMKFIPECYGSWTLTGGYTYYHLGDGTKDFNVGNVRDDNENEHVFSGGLGIAF